MRLEGDQKSLAISDRGGSTLVGHCFSLEERLQVLLDYEILDTPEEHDFDALATLAADIFEAPIAAITLFDANRLWLKAKVGIDTRESPPEESICVHGLRGPNLLVVPNATEDSRFRYIPAVSADDGVRFYAGARLENDAGVPLGMICVADTEARSGITAVQARMLRTIAAQVVTQMELRRECRQRAKLATEAEQARGEAMSAAAAKTTFLANMSHEIRTPLNAIIGFTDLILEDDGLSDVHRRQLRLVKNSGGALLAVVNDILDFSKMEAGKVELAPRIFDVSHLAQTTLDIVRQSAETKGLNISVETSRELSRYFIGDDTRLRQILLNLLSNAIKFTRHGSVKLSVKGTCSSGGKDLLTFVVADTGAGVPADQEHRLFQEFSQANSSVAREHGGTGLGLAICRTLIDLMGGEIGFRPRSAGGSEFWFNIRLEPADEAAARGTGTPILEVQSKRILVVEDVVANQELATAMLSRSGHHVEVASNGREALALVQDRPFDLVLMDVQMPVMDGVTATRLIRLLPGRVRNIPIIALTANIMPDQVANFRHAGMDDHVGKPINLAELTEAIARNASPKNHVHPESAVTQSYGPDCFDEKVFCALAEMLPADRLKVHLRTFQSGLMELDKFEGTSEIMKALAHSLVGQAGMFGFARLSKLCRDLENACETGLPDEGLLSAMRKAIAAANVELDACKMKPPLVVPGHFQVQTSVSR